MSTPTPSCAGNSTRCCVSIRLWTKSCTACRPSGAGDRGDARSARARVGRSPLSLSRGGYGIRSIGIAVKRSKEKRSTRWFILGFVVQLVAVVLAILMVGVGGLPILQLTVAISIAVTALNRSRTFEDRSKEYGVAAQELSMLLEAVELTETQEQFASAVRDLETVIGKEHSAWFARRK